MKQLLLLLCILPLGGYAQSTNLLSDSVAIKTDYFKNGKLHIVNSSHQDIAWVNSPEACMKERADHIMIPVLDRMKNDKSYCYSVESAMYLEEFLSFYPDRYDEILQYTREGRLEWGATYSQPYQGMYEGEALVRQNYLGRKLLKRLLPGCDFRAGWNVDVPGLSLQFPQIMAKSGIPYYNTSRFTTGFYEWFSPDGSSIKVISTGQYSGYSWPFCVAKNDTELADAFANTMNYWGDYQEKRDISPACLVLVSQDASKPVNYNSVMSKWNNERLADKNTLLPEIKYSTSTMFFDDLTRNNKAKFDVVRGERPDMWLYIHGPSHYESVSASRKASRTLLAAETFSSINSILSKDWNLYPSKTFEQAWKNAVYADHGWGGYDGITTDLLFKTKFEAALDSASYVLNSSLDKISDFISYDKSKKGYAITVFNSLAWERTDPVTFTIDVRGRKHNHFKLVDESGNSVPFQFTDVNLDSQKGKNEFVSIVFVPENVPSLGFKTYYLLDDEGSMRHFYGNQRVDTKNYENRFYKIEFGNGGINSLYDKEVGCEVFDISHFKGAELFTVKSEGTGAGEFSDVQQPTLEGFDKLSNYSCAWNCVESGDVRDIFQTGAQFKDTKATLRIVIYKNIKKIDVEVDLNAYMGENWREYRLAFPLNEAYSKVIYDVPMGVLEVGKDEMEGKAGHKGLQPSYDVVCSSVHPREIQDWFGAYGNDRGFTIGSDVAVFDWVNIFDTLSMAKVLQPVLISNRKSCHWEGNYYLQAGKHSFSFSLNSYKGNWKGGYKAGMQKNRPLYAVVKSNQDMKDGSLPSTYSFGGIRGNDVIVSAVKKCEDDESVVMRCYDISGGSQEVEFNFFKDLNSVQHTNMIEENGKLISNKKQSFNYPLGKYSIETFKLNIKY